MYVYRNLTPKQRTELVAQRLAHGYPEHSPPHPRQDQRYYLLTAACYEHRPHIGETLRRQQLLGELFGVFTAEGINIHAWVILTTHYHLLVHVPQFGQLSRLFRLVHGRTAHSWNEEDRQPGRKIWFRFTDRAIRSERHYYTTLNYIHYNPVKHKLAVSPYDWTESSVHWYREYQGREWLRDLWRSHPLRSYGEGWDEDS